MAQKAKFLKTVRPRRTRPYGTRTLLGPNFEKGSNIFEIRDIFEINNFANHPRYAIDRSKAQVSKIASLLFLLIKTMHDAHSIIN